MANKTNILEQDFLIKQIRLSNLLFGMSLNLIPGKSRQERFKAISRYQADTPKTRWLCYQKKGK